MLLRNNRKYHKYICGVNVYHISKPFTSTSSLVLALAQMSLSRDVKMCITFLHLSYLGDLHPAAIFQMLSNVDVVTQNSKMDEQICLAFKVL